MSALSHHQLTLSGAKRLARRRATRTHRQILRGFAAQDKVAEQASDQV
jgi:hypothetical protein